MGTPPPPKTWPHFLWKIFPTVPSEDLPWPFPHVLSHITLEKRPATSSLQLPERSPLSLLQTKQLQFTQPLLIWFVFQSLHQVFFAVYTCIQATKCPSCSKGPKTEHSTQDEFSPVLCTRGQSLPRPAGCTISNEARMLFVVLATWAHFYLMFRCLLTSTIRSFSAEQLSSCSSPVPYQGMELLWPKCSAQYWTLLNIIQLDMVLWSSLSWSLCRAYPRYCGTKTDCTVVSVATTFCDSCWDFTQAFASGMVISENAYHVLNYKMLHVSIPV